ncbi:MAG: TonB-dependent receptor, partial [Calditrichaeota bacterium]
MVSPRSMILLVVLLLFARMIKAELPADSVKYRFKPITVTAGKVNGVQREIAAGVSIINEKQLQSAYNSSALDIVKDFVPSVFITERALMGYGVASGAAGGITIRGIGGSPVTGVLMLRDGRPDMMGIMGHSLPDAYSTNGLERIEVLRGPASFLYGTNAMGGVINLVSKKVHEPGFDTGITLGAGNYNSQQVNGHHGGKVGDLDYFLTAGYQKTDGHRENSDYKGSSFSAHLGYDLSPSTFVELNANYSDTYLLDPGIASAAKADQWYDIHRSGADLTLGHTGRAGESVAKIHGNFGRHEIFDGWRSNDHTAGIMFYHNAKFWHGNITTIGFDYKSYGGDAEDSVPQSPAINYSEQNIQEYAPYFHFQQLMLRKLIFSTGLRMEQHELYGSEVLPKVGLIYNAFKTTSLRISAAKGFRSPSIRELYIFPPRNEQLMPERMWSYEIGLLQQITNGVEAEIAVFQLEGENMIRTVFAKGKPQFVNSGVFTHTGYEVLLRWFLLSRADLDVAWSDLNLGDQTLGAPEKKLTASLGYEWARVNVRAHILHIANLFAADARLQRMPDYTLVNLSVAFSPWNKSVVKFWLKNALDKNYEIIKGYPMPGRTFM